MWKRVDSQSDDCFLIAALFVAVVIVGFALSCCCPSAYGGWGPRGCPSVGGPAFVPALAFQAVTPLTWHYDSDWEDTGRASLYRGNQLVGSYSYSTGIYFPADGSAAYRPEGWPVWRTEVAKDGCKCKKCDGKCKCGKGKCCDDKGCKCCCPSEERVVTQVEQNFGLELDKIGTSGSPRTTLHDGVLSREVTRDEAKRLLAKDGLGDDSAKPYLVVVCNDPKLRERISSDFYSGPLFAWARENVRFQVYPGRDHHHLEAFKLDKDQRYQDSGLMIAVLSAPDKEGFGKRLYAQYDYEGGPEKLSVESRRRIDPNWDPNKLPGPAKPDVAPVPELSAWVLIGQLFAALPSWSYVLASLGVAVLLWRGAK